MPHEPLTDELIEAPPDSQGREALEISRATVKWQFDEPPAEDDAPPSEDDEPGDDAPDSARPTKAWF